MAAPEPMVCLADECPSPMRCNAAGGCVEAQRDGAQSYELALSECRKRGVIPKAWMREVQE
jgi:hypothetical protein